VDNNKIRDAVCVLHYEIKGFTNHVYRKFIRACRNHKRYILDILWDDTPDARKLDLYDSNYDILDLTRL